MSFPALMRGIRKNGSVHTTALSLLVTLGLSAQVAPKSGIPQTTADSPKTLREQVVERKEARREAVRKGLVQDRADGRKEWERFWFGPEPTVDYLDYKKALATEHLRKYAASFPGGRDLKAPAIPGAGLTWSNLGPFGGTSVYTPSPATDVDSGRPAVQGIVPHPTNPNILYWASSNGGVFKCTNADVNSATDWTWTPITETLPNSSGSGNQGVGALAMSPADPETLYLGLGDFRAALGRGIYKTTNGGATWTELGALGSTTIIVRILPLDANTILVAGNDGLYRSTNGGTSFSRITVGGVGSQVIWSLARCSGNNLVLSRQDGAGAGGFFYSSDGGASWTASTVDASVTAQNMGRITVATSAASGTRVWAIAQNRSTGVFAVGLFKSDDAGVNWTFVSGSGQLFTVSSDGAQATYNHGIAVAPGDANQVFVGSNLSLYRTLDGGSTWAQMTSWVGSRRVYAHADFHTSAWSGSGNVLYFGSDGGLCILKDPFRATPPTSAGQIASDTSFVDNRRNKGLSTHLIYNIASTTATSPSDSKWRISIGLQDNSGRVRRASGSSNFDDNFGLGDGFGTVWHPVDGNKLLMSSYNTNIEKSTNGGSSSFGSTTGITEAGSNSAPFVTRIVLGYGDATGNTVYTTVNQKVYKSTDFGDTWTAMPMTGYAGQTIRNVNASKSNVNAVAIVTNSGTGYVTYNGTSWTQFGSFPNNGLNMGYVWFDTSNDQVLYATSVATTASNSHLWKSTNGGSSWTAIDVSNGFPFGIPVHVIQNDPAAPGTLLAGTDFGVYISTNGGTSWSRYGAGLPLVAVRDLYIAPDGSFVRAGTYGRGVWELLAAAPATPTLTSFTPTSGPVGTGVTLTGTNFTGATAVAFNGTAATFTVDNATQVSTSVPAGATTGTITVTTPGGTATSATNFTVTPPPAPTLTSFTPATGAVGTGVTLTGTNFTGATAVTFNGTTATFVVNSAAQITTSVPAGATTGVIRVTTAGGTATSATNFTVTAPPISVSISPTTATLLTGGTQTFTATVLNGPSTVTYTVEEGGGGTVNGAGLYTAPGTPGTYHVRATSTADPTAFARATVTVVTVTLSVAPTTATILVGQTLGLTATVSSGGVNWSTSGGSLSAATGLTTTLTAPALPGLVTVTATSALDGTKTAAAVVNVKTRDLDGNGVVEVLDLAFFARAYSGPGNPTTTPAADLDGDGDVDDADLAILLAGL